MMHPSSIQPDVELRDYLRRFGSAILQGYYFDQPLKVEDFQKKYC